MSRSNRITPGLNRYALVLAAGKSTRFKSSVPKILHPLCGKPLLCHVLDKLKHLKTERIFVVISPDSQDLKSLLKGYPVDFAIQKEPLGTGHAVMAAAPLLRQREGSLLVLYGDAPLIRPETLRELVLARETSDADQVLLAAQYEDPAGYGRIIRNKKGAIVDIIEEKETTPEQRAIQEVNVGFYCFKISSLLQLLGSLSRENAAGEYYLTDAVRFLNKEGKKVVAVQASDPEETVGVNNRQDLAEVETRLRSQIAQKWMLEGVTIINPGSVLIDESVVLSPDTLIYPGVILEGNTRIAPGCIIYAYSHLRNAVLQEGVIVDHGSVVRDSVLGTHTRIGPFAHLRGENIIGSNVRIGNFVEIKHSRVGDHTKAAHLTYLGDAEVGSDVNIGAGTITCNYDGIQKNKTIIEDGVFIGSDSQLIAPVTIGRGSYVAAGSSITEDVPEGSLGIARARQVNKEGWVKERAAKLAKKKKTDRLTTDS